MDTKAEISDVLAELDACRVSRGMSRQAVADACNVSEATISRVFNGTVEPTYVLVQSIAAAVQYKPAEPVVIPAECSQESYIAYLKELIQRRDIEHDRRVRSLQAHYNMLHRQDRRTIVVLGGILGLLVAAFILWLIIDVTHPDIGWFQR